MIKRDDGWRFYGAAIGLAAGRFLYMHDSAALALLAIGCCVACGLWTDWKARRP